MQQKAFGIDFSPFYQGWLVHWSVLGIFVRTNYSFEIYTYFTGLLLTSKIISTVLMLCLTPPGDIEYNP